LRRRWGEATVRNFGFEGWAGRWQPAHGGAGARLRLLLTGFGPFPGIPVNASGVLVEQLGRRIATVHRDVSLACDVLPTEWQAGPAALERLVARIRPHVALHFGVAASIGGFRLELKAENEAQLHADALGLMPLFERISCRGPDHLRTTLPIDAIRARLLAMDLPVETSDDAGKYLCNSALYRSLALARRERPVRLAGFVHIPSDYPAQAPRRASPLEPPPAPALGWAQVLEGAGAIVEVCLAHARERLLALA
jgi:pyroglutamyl-peptidase